VQGKSPSIDKKFANVIKATDELIDMVSAHLKNLPGFWMKMNLGARQLLRLPTPRIPGVNVTQTKDA
jgi:hypothetical protein